jgi:hypothetical protein
VSGLSARAWSRCPAIPPAAPATSSPTAGSCSPGTPYDGITGYRGPAVASRAFTHDSHAALASLTALDTINAGLLLPGHGEPFPGTPADAAAQARSTGLR